MKTQEINTGTVVIERCGQKVTVAPGDRVLLYSLETLGIDGVDACGTDVILRILDCLRAGASCVEVVWITIHSSTMQGHVDALREALNLLAFKDEKFFVSEMKSVPGRSLLVLAIARRNIDEILNRDGSSQIVDTPTAKIGLATR